MSVINLQQQEKRLEKILEDMFAPFPMARDFMVQYIKYINLIDDAIDTKVDYNHILRIGAQAVAVHSNPFYMQNVGILGFMELVINNEYGDSVNWEKSGEDWKLRHADAIRHCGLNMLFSVLILLHGYDKVRAISADIRAFYFAKHLYDFFNSFEKEAS